MTNIARRSDAVSLEALRQRRLRLKERFKGPVLLWAGRAAARNFAANPYPFRASSHFLYFAGLPIEGAVIWMQDGQLTLLMDEPSSDDALWHGSSPSRSEVASVIGASAHYPLTELSAFTEGAATIPVQDWQTRQQQAQLLGRTWLSARDLQGYDLTLAEALVQLRLCQDEAAVASVQQAVDVTVRAHLAGMACTRQSCTEAQVRATMEAVIAAEPMTTAYTSIVTVQGEILHNLQSFRDLNPGDLLLADMGAEHSFGWAADITRTWPVSGRWSPTQRAVYEVVLAAHDACIASVKPGIEYEAIHLTAAKTIAAGLSDLGIFKGSVETLVERAAHALFFPHGVGHLLGLDVHDMEDLGDLAGYVPGRARTHRYGMQYLRLNRPLLAGMIVTIEPGFYQVPGILASARQQQTFEDCVNWDRLAEFEDVRGIRIEDDVLLTEIGCRVLSAALPTSAKEIEELVR
jgi:Xaa-Pro aminopeptidase